MLVLKLKVGINNLRRRSRIGIGKANDGGFSLGYYIMWRVKWTGEGRLAETFM